MRKNKPNPVYRRNTIHVRLDIGLYDLVKMAAKHRKQTAKAFLEEVLTDYLSENDLMFEKL